MDITDLLSSILGGPQSTPQTRQPQPQPQQGGLGSLAKLAIPLILMALYRNASSRKKGESLTNALRDHEKSPAEQISTDIFGKIQKADTVDGGKILGHVLGKDHDVIAGQIAAQAGVSIDQAKSMMGSLAPLIMEMLAEKTKGNRTPDSVRDTVRDQLQKVDQTDGLPGLPDIFRDMLAQKKPAPKQQEQAGGGLGGLLKDLMGGQEAADEDDEPGLLESLGGVGGITDILGKLIR